MKNVRPGKGNTVIDEAGRVLNPPRGWVFLPAGDAGVTRKITAKKQYWRVQVKRGRRVMSKGVWAPVEIVEDAKKEVTAVRATDAYKKRLEGDRQRRAKKQSAYEKEFFTVVKNYLAFAPCYREMAEKMARAVTDHAVPVGSGTVARTAMIPVEERAAKAVIAWMRHKTTAYDGMTIPRVKGMRREVRRMLAKRSVEVLQNYRSGAKIAAGCPLKRAVDRL